MFGTNPLRGPDAGDGETLWVQSVFGTIQGEGPLAGYPAIFVRLAGCNLRCHFCDTDFESSTWKPSVQELLHLVQECMEEVETGLIVLTGGEPLRQGTVVQFMRAALDEGYTIQVETAGTVWPKGMDSEDMEGALEDGKIVIVCSPKTGTVHSRIKQWCREYKYIVGADDAGEPGTGLPTASTQVLGTTAKIFKPQHGPTIWIQPRMDYIEDSKKHTPVPDDHKTLENARHAADLCMKYGYRLTLQMHKIVGLE